MEEVWCLLFYKLSFTQLSSHVSAFWAPLVRSLCVLCSLPLLMFISEESMTSPISSLLCWEINPFGAFLLRSVCVPFINMHEGRVHDVTHCYNLGKKSVRVKGGMSLRNGMWHGLRNDIIMRTVIYQNDLKK